MSDGAGQKARAAQLAKDRKAHLLSAIPLTRPSQRPAMLIQESAVVPALTD